MNEYEDTLGHEWNDCNMNEYVSSQYGWIVISQCNVKNSSIKMENMNVDRKHMENHFNYAWMVGLWMIFVEIFKHEWMKNIPIWSEEFKCEIGSINMDGEVCVEFRINEKWIWKIN